MNTFGLETIASISSMIKTIGFGDILQILFIVKQKYISAILSLPFWSSSIGLTKFRSGLPLYVEYERKIKRIKNFKKESLDSKKQNLKLLNLLKK